MKIWYDTRQFPENGNPKNTKKAPGYQGKNGNFIFPGIDSGGINYQKGNIMKIDSYYLKYL